MNRRSFLRTSGISLAGALTLPSIATTQTNLSLEARMKEHPGDLHLTFPDVGADRYALIHFDVPKEDSEPRSENDPHYNDAERMRRFSDSLNTESLDPINLYILEKEIKGENGVINYVVHGIKPSRDLGNVHIAIGSIKDGIIQNVSELVQATEPKTPWSSIPYQERLFRLKENEFGWVAPSNEQGEKDYPDLELIGLHGYFQNLGRLFYNIPLLGIDIEEEKFSSAITTFDVDQASDAILRISHSALTPRAIPEYGVLNGTINNGFAPVKMTFNGEKIREQHSPFDKGPWQTDTNQVKTVQGENVLEIRYEPDEETINMVKAHTGTFAETFFSVYQLIGVGLKLT